MDYSSYFKRFRTRLPGSEMLATREMLGEQNSSVRFSWRAYRRSFCRPLQTHHGLWQERQGIIIRLEDEKGGIGFGEIAPLPWFGSETLEQAQALCQELGDRLTFEALATLPDTHPACQFGLAIAWDTLQHPLQSADLPLSAALLPSGSAALTVWTTYWSQGHSTFKWKIGVASLREELVLFHRLMAELPEAVRIRLDANGGLSLEEAEAWLDCCANYSQVEYLEQPLPVDQVEAMQQLGDRFPTPLALDESVATLADLKCYYHQGWKGVFVVKPAIAGYPQELLTFCHQHHPTVVLSSVFETAIAYRYIAHRFLPSLPQTQLIPGLGTQHWFFDDGFNAPDPATLWHRLDS